MRSECVGIINLDNKNDLTMNQLTNVRPIASLPIAGRYRVIDFFTFKHGEFRYN